MRKLLSITAIAVISILFSSCAGRSGGYKGYKNSPYTVRGQHYRPLSVEQSLKYKSRGIASWYNESKKLGLVRGNTAIGEKVMPWHISGAHKTLALPCVVKVTNLKNGKSLKMRVNDRGPYIPGRIIDVTPRAASKLGFKDQGLTNVEVEVLSVGDGAYKRKNKRKKFLFFF